MPICPKCGSFWSRDSARGLCEACDAEAAGSEAESVQDRPEKAVGPENPLTAGERTRVIVISLGFVVVFGFIIWLGVQHNWFSSWIKGIQDRFWERRRAGPFYLPVGVENLFLLSCYLVALPAGMVFWVLAATQGVLGKRTRLTRWVLRQSSQQEVRERHEEVLSRHGSQPVRHFLLFWVQRPPSPTDRVLQTYVPPAVGWSILLGVLALGAAFALLIALRS